MPGDQGINRLWFVRGDGIDRGVITSDIQRHLGPNATVRPGLGSGEDEGVPGYWIKAYRTLTAYQLEDIKSASARWQNEQRRGGTSDTYEGSTTHHQASRGEFRRGRDSPNAEPGYSHMSGRREPRIPDSRLTGPQISRSDDMDVDDYGPPPSRRFDDRNGFMPDRPPYAQDRPTFADDRPSFGDGRPSFQEPHGYRSSQGQYQYGMDPRGQRDPRGEPRIDMDMGPRGQQQYPTSGPGPNYPPRQQDGGFYPPGPGSYGGPPLPMPPSYGSNMYGGPDSGRSGQPPRDNRRDPPFGGPGGYPNDMRSNNDARYAYPSPTATIPEPHSGPPSGSYAQPPPQGGNQPRFYDGPQPPVNAGFPSGPPQNGAFGQGPPTGPPRGPNQGQRPMPSSNMEREAQRRRLN